MKDSIIEERKRNFNSSILNIYILATPTTIMQAREEYVMKVRKEMKEANIKRIRSIRMAIDEHQQDFNNQDIEGILIKVDPELTNNLISDVNHMKKSRK